MRLNEKGQTLEMFLSQYDPAKYERPSVTVDILVYTKINGKLSLLLVKRKDHPFIGEWVLPGGFVNMDENLKDAAARELEEETGLKNLPLFQLGAYGDVGRDPRTRIITVAYIALSKPDALHPKAGDDAADAGLYRLEHQIEQKDANLSLHSITLTGKGNTILVKAEEKGHGVLSKKRLVAPGLGTDHGLLVLDSLLLLDKLDKQFLADSLG
ncbi:MAG: NUDIX domain-containing protein [Christensenellales bacterium]